MTKKGEEIVGGGRGGGGGDRHTQRQHAELWNMDS